MSTMSNLSVQGTMCTDGEKSPNALKYEAAQREARFQEEIEKYGELKPIEMTQDSLPGFPMDCLTEDFRKLAEQLSANKQAPVDAVGASLLSMISLAEGGRFKVDPGKSGVYQDGINLFFMTVMESGTGKSEIMKVLKKPVLDFTVDFNKKNEVQIAEDAAELGYLKKRLEKVEKLRLSGKADKADMEMAQKELMGFKPMKKLCCVTDNVTSEALENLLAENNGVMGVISTEGGVIDIMAGCYRKDGTSNIDVYLHGYSNEELYKVRIVGGSIHLDALYLTVNFTIQPTVLNHFMCRDFIEKGMTARFLYSIPPDFGKRCLRVSYPIDPLCLANYENKIRDIMSIERNLGELYELRFSEASTERMVVYNDDVLQKRIGEDLACIIRSAKRMIGMTIRLAGILHVMEHGSKAVENREISEETIGKAIRLTDYFLEHAKAAHRVVLDGEVLETLKYVWEKCCELQVSVIRHDTLREKCRGRLKTNDDLAPYIKALMDRGYLRLLPEDKTKGEKNGRPKARCYGVNPRLYPEIRAVKNTVANLISGSDKPSALGNSGLESAGDAC